MEASNESNIRDRPMSTEKQLRTPISMEDAQIIAATVLLRLLAAQSSACRNVCERLRDFKGDLKIRGNEDYVRFLLFHYLQKICCCLYTNPLALLLSQNVVGSYGVKNIFNYYSSSTSF